MRPAARATARLLLCLVAFVAMLAAGLHAPRIVLPAKPVAQIDVAPGRRAPAAEVVKGPRASMRAAIRVGSRVRDAALRCMPASSVDAIAAGATQASGVDGHGGRWRPRARRSRAELMVFLI